MFNKQTDFGLFFSMPLDATDRRNFEASGVPLVMVPWALGSDLELARACAYVSKHGAEMVLRMEDADLARPPGILQARLRVALDNARVRAVILGVEPDFPFDWTYAGEWGNGRDAWDHAGRVETVRATLAGLGPALVSPGWRHRGSVEIDPPQPGTMAWREITRDAYNACDGAGVHFYGFGWGPGEEHPNRMRFRAQIREWAMLHHRPLWIDEINVVYGDEAFRWWALMGMADDLTRHHGDRVAFFCPFVSNGVGNAYDPALIMRAPEGYTALRAWLEKG